MLIYCFYILYHELLLKKLYITPSLICTRACVPMCVHVYIFTLIFGYLVRISFIPQIAKLYNGGTKLKP